MGPQPNHRILPITSKAIPRVGCAFELDIDLATYGGEQRVAWNASFKPERFMIAGGGSAWSILSFTVDEREQLDQELPGELFAATKASGAGNARWVDTIRESSKLHFKILRKHDDGRAEFMGALFGVDVEPAQPQRAFSGALRFRDEATQAPIPTTVDGPERVLPGEAAWFIARPTASFHALCVEGIEIDLGCEEWTIEDMRVGKRSQLAEAGSVSGDLFAPGLASPRIAMDPVPTGGEFAIKAAYRGSNPKGRFFGATCACRLYRSL